MSQKPFTFLISEDLAEKFEIALKLNKEQGAQVMEALIRSYVVESFSSASRELESPTVDPTTEASVQRESQSVMTLDKIEKVYAVAKQVHQGALTRLEGKEQVVEDTGMKDSSASFYISAFLDMMEGKGFKRAINQTATRYYLENIRKDYGDEAFRRAIEATRLHLRYLNEVAGVNLPGQARLLEELESLPKK